MIINNITAFPTSYFGESINNQIHEEISNVFSLTATEEENVHKKEIISPTANVQSDLWEDLSKKYDVRNATLDEIKTISNTLYNAGKISFLDAALLTFDLDSGMRNMRAKFNIPDFSDLGSVENPQKDWIAEFERRKELSLTNSNPQSYQNMKNILHILHRLERL